MYTYDLHTKTPDSRKQIRKNTNFEMKNSKPFLALFSSVCTNVNKMGRQKNVCPFYSLPSLLYTICIDDK